MSTYALLGTAKPSSGNATITTAVAVDVGDVILLFGQGNAAITASAISDSGAGGGNTYTPSLGAATGAPVLCGYRSVAVATKALPVGSTITIDNTGGKTRQSHVAVVVKNPAASPVDKANATQGNSATASAGATGTLAAAAEVLVAGFHAIQTSDPASPGTGWTKLGSVTTSGGSNDRTSVVYVKEVASTATSTPTSGLAAAANWAGQVVTVKTAADPPPSDYEWSQWNGTAEVPLTVSGVWDGSAVQPLDPAATTVT